MNVNLHSSIILFFWVTLIWLRVVYTQAHGYEEKLTVYNGYEVKPHSIPFQAFLTIYYNGSSEYCGGSLISNNYILTAAHCIKGADYALVSLGVHNRSVVDENVQIFNSTEVYAHEDFGFVGQKILNDIGVIKLPHAVQTTHAVRPGKLESTNDYKSNPNQVGINATVSGWGRTGNPGNYSEVLLAGLLHVEDPTYCKSSTSVYEDDQFLCIALRSRKDPESSSGDSGGPLFKIVEDDQVIIGLVSVGGEAYEADTNVGYYQEWIAEHTDVVFD